MADRQYIPMAEVKDTYGISRSSAYRAINAGKLKIRKFGRTTLLKVSELEELIESGTQTKWASSSRFSTRRGSR